MEDMWLAELDEIELMCGEALGLGEGDLRRIKMMRSSREDILYSVTGSSSVSLFSRDSMTLIFFVEGYLSKFEKTNLCPFNFKSKK